MGTFNGVIFSGNLVLVLELVCLFMSSRRISEHSILFVVHLIIHSLNGLQITVGQGVKGVMRKGKI